MPSKKDGLCRFLCIWWVLITLGTQKSRHSDPGSHTLLVLIEGSPPPSSLRFVPSFDGEKIPALSPTQQIYSYEEHVALSRNVEHSQPTCDITPGYDSAYKANTDAPSIHHAPSILGVSSTSRTSGTESITDSTGGLNTACTACMGSTEPRVQAVLAVQTFEILGSTQSIKNIEAVNTDYCCCVHIKACFLPSFVSTPSVRPDSLS